MDKDNNNNTSNLNFYQDAGNDLENNNMVNPYQGPDNGSIPYVDPNNAVSPYQDTMQEQPNMDIYSQSNMDMYGQNQSEPIMDMYTQNQEQQSSNNTMQNSFDDQNFYEPVDMNSSNIPEAPTEFTTYNAFDENTNNMQNSYEPIDNNMQNNYEPIDNNMQNNYEPIDNNMQNNYEPIDNNMQANYEPIDNNMQNDYEPIDNNMQANYEPIGDDSNTYNSMNTNNYNGDSDYNMEFVKTWMDNLYDKAHSKKFNWSSAFFGGIYFLYRKLYLTGILFILLSILVTCLPMILLNKNAFLALGLVPAISLIFFLIYGFAFYPLYRNHVRKQLNKLKTAIPDNGELINMANKKGHTSLVSVIIAVIIAPIISGSLITLTAGKQINNFLSKLPNHDNTTATNDTFEPITDIQTYNFLNQYTLEYDALSWFLTPSTNTLSKGNYSLIYSGQYLEDLQNSLGSDPTSPSGRSSLLTTLVTSLESQAASVNLTTEAGTSNFVMGTNAYYGYLDVISPDNVSRYYFILIPEKDILFQFILSTNDTSIDYTTNLEVINILTSVYEDDSHEQGGTLQGNTIDNSISDNSTNTIDTNSTLENSISTNDISSNNVISNNISTNDTSSNTVASNVTAVNNIR